MFPSLKPSIMKLLIPFMSFSLSRCTKVLDWRWLINIMVTWHINGMVLINKMLNFY